MFFDNKLGEIMFQKRHLNAMHEVMLDVADEVISNENMEAVSIP